MLMRDVELSGLDSQRQVKDTEHLGGQLSGLVN